MLRLLLKDSLVYTASKVLTGIVGLFSIPIFIKYFGVSAYGSYSLMLALSNAMSSLFLGWIWQSYMRYSRHGFAPRLFFQLIAAAIMFATACFLLIGLTWVPAIAGVSTGLVFFIFVSFVLYGSSRVYLQSARAMKRYVSLELVRVLGIALVPLALAWHFGQRSFELLLIGFGIASIASPLFLWRHHSQELDRSPVASIGVQRLAQYGVPLSIWLSVASMQMYLDRYFLNHYFGQVAAGTFSGVADITVKIGAVFIIPVSSAIIPIFATHSNISGYFRDKRYFIAIYAICFLYASFITATITWWVPLLGLDIDHLFAGRVGFFCFFLGGAIWQCSILFHKYLEMHELSGSMLRNILIANVCHYALFLLFVNWSGIDALAISYLTSSIVYSSLCWLGVGAVAPSRAVM